MSIPISRLRLFVLATSALFVHSPLLCAEEHSPVSFSGSVDLFGSHYTVDRDSLFNPDNVIAQLPSQQYDLLLRPKLTIDLDKLKLWAGPRFSARTKRINGEYRSDHSIYLQEAGALYTINDHISLAVERNVMLWGPSLFSSPSNPFFSSSNQSNPFVELSPRDFARARYAPNDRWAVSAISNMRLGRDTDEYADFSPITAVSVEYIGDMHSINLVAARRSGLIHSGLFAQWTINDALLVYTDLGYRTRTDARVPARNDSTIGWAFSPRGNRDEFDGLVGASYTTSRGDTLSVELRHNAQGLDNQEFDDLTRAATDALVAAENPALVPDAALLLGAAADLRTRSLRRNYLHAQYLVRELTPRLGINVLAVHNLDDRSTQWIGVANYYVTDESRMSLNVVANSGNRGTEFRRFFDLGLFMGYKYFF